MSNTVSLLNVSLGSFLPDPPDKQNCPAQLEPSVLQSVMCVQHSSSAKW